MYVHGYCILKWGWHDGEEVEQSEDVEGNIVTAEAHHVQNISAEDRPSTRNLVYNVAAEE